jgi:hypothetical protein
MLILNRPVPQTHSSTYTIALINTVGTTTPENFYFFLRGRRRSLTFFKAVVFNSAEDTIDSNISAIVGPALLKVSTSIMLSVGGVIARCVLKEPDDARAVVVLISS